MSNFRNRMRNQQQQRPRNGLNSSTSNKRLMNHITGGKFIPSDDPPVIVGSPWNNAVIIADLTFKVNTYKYFKQSDLVKIMRTQLGFSGDNVKANFEYKVKSLAVWAYPYTSGVTNEEFRISVLPMSIMSTNNVELDRLDSNSVRNKFAKVGYFYPVSHTTVPLSTSGTDVTLVSYVSSKDVAGFLHFKLLWRGADQGFSYTEFVPRTRFVSSPHTSLLNEDKTDEDILETKSNVDSDELVKIEKCQFDTDVEEVELVRRYVRMKLKDAIEDG